MTEQNTQSVQRIIADTLNVFQDGEERVNWLAERIVEQLELHMRRTNTDIIFRPEGLAHLTSISHLHFVHREEK